MEQLSINFEKVEKHINALNSIQKEYRKSEQNPNESEKRKLLANFYLESGQVNYLLHFYQDCISDLKKAGKILEKLDEPNLLLELNFLLGKTYLHFNNYDHCELHLKKALRLAKQVESKDRELRILEALGMLYNNRALPERAFRYFTQKKELLADNESLGILRTANTFMNIGNVISKIDFLNALSYLFNAYDIYTKEEFNEGIDQSLINTVAMS